MIFTKEELAKIPRDEKYELLSELWESLQNEPSPEVLAEHKKILDQREAEARENPDSFLDWKDVKEELMQRIHDAN